MRKNQEKTTSGKKARRSKTAALKAEPLTHQSQPEKSLGTTVVRSKGRAKVQRPKKIEDEPQNAFSILKNAVQRGAAALSDETVRIESPLELIREPMRELKASFAPKTIAKPQGKISSLLASRPQLNLKNGIPLLLGLVLLSSLVWPKEWLSWSIPTLTSDHPTNSSAADAVPQAASAAPQNLPVPAPVPAKAKSKIVNVKPQTQSSKSKAIKKVVKTADAKKAHALNQKKPVSAKSEARVQKEPTKAKSPQASKVLPKGKDSSKKTLAKAFQ